MKADLLILDGRNLLWRTSDAFKMLSVEVGDEEIGVGGIYGFLLTSMRIHQRYGGRTAVAWEGSNNFRHKLYPEYKAKRPTDQTYQDVLVNINEQERRLKPILRALGLTQWSGIDCEADDVIGRLATAASFRGLHTVIYTGDSDLRQLVNSEITVVSPGFKGKDTVYDREKVHSKHGVYPEFIADQKALAGDSSDNIPGIRGIGPKTANKLIHAFGGVENVIANALGTDEVSPCLISDWPIAQRFLRPIVDGQHDIRLFKKLTKIQVNCKMSQIKPRRDHLTLMDHLRGYGFQSLGMPMEQQALLRMAG